MAFHAVQRTTIFPGLRSISGFRSFGGGSPPGGGGGGGGTSLTDNKAGLTRFVCIKPYSTSIDLDLELFARPIRWPLHDDTLFAVRFFPDIQETQGF